MKRLFYLFAFIAVVAFALFLGYFFRYRSEVLDRVGVGVPRDGGGLPQRELPTGATPPQTVVGEGAPPSEIKPPASPEEKFGVVSNFPALNYFVDRDKNTIIAQPDGEILKIAPSGQKTVLNSTAIANLNSLSFSYDGQKILAAFGSSFESVQASVFDIVKKTWAPLPSKIQSPVWSPKNYEVAYLGNTGGKTTINLIDLESDGAQPSQIFSFNGQDITLRWILPNTMLFGEKVSALAPASIWRFDVKKKTFSPILTNQPGLKVAWNASGTEGLAFASSPTTKRGGELRLITDEGDTIRTLSFITLPSKCVFGSKKILSPLPSSGTGSVPKATSTVPLTTTPALFCAIPRDQKKLQASMLPDAYHKKSLFTIDDFYEIDLRDGKITPLFAESKEIDAQTLKIFNERLFFINRFDNKLYSIAL